LTAARHDSAVELRSGRKNGFAEVEQQNAYSRAGPQALFCAAGIARSEWQLVVWDDQRLGWRGLPSLSRRVLDVGTVDGEDDGAHFVDELEDGERGVG
jgi:hypothetical protein